MFLQENLDFFCETMFKFNIISKYFDVFLSIFTNGAFIIS